MPETIRTYSKKTAIGKRTLVTLSQSRDGYTLAEAGREPERFNERAQAMMAFEAARERQKGRG